jgi:hypothetical protein
VRTLTERFLPPSRIPVAVVAVVVAFKLWITSYIRTVPLYAPHDATNFLDHAQTILAGAWFGNYSSLTLIKGAFFPAYLAAISELGLGVNLAHQLTYLFACWIACLAIAPIVRTRAALLGIGIVLVFNPMTFDYMSWVTYRSQVSGTLSLLTVACVAALYVRRDRVVRARIPWAIGLGFSLGALWLTREEGIWIVPCVFVLAGACVYHELRRRRVDDVSPAPLLLVPSAIWVAMVGIVTALNGHYYGWAVTTELQSREYIAAYGSLERIAHAASGPAVPIPKEAREIAYRVSPLARELDPFIDGAQAQRGWFSASCGSGYSCTDIAGGWIHWSIRGAVQLAGYYDSGEHARSFYSGMSEQIDRACDAHKIRCGPKRRSLAPRLSGQLGPVVQHFILGVTTFARLGSFGIDAWQISETPPATFKEYNFVARDVEAVAQPLATYDQMFKTSLLLAVERAYAALLPIALVLIVIGTIARIGWFALRRRVVGEAYTIFIAIAASGVALLGLLATIDALSFPGFNDEYFASLYSVTFFAAAVVIATETVWMFDFLERLKKRT